MSGIPQLRFWVSKQSLIVDETSRMLWCEEAGSCKILSVVRGWFAVLWAKKLPNTSKCVLEEINIWKRNSFCSDIELSLLFSAIKILLSCKPCLMAHGKHGHWFLCVEVCFYTCPNNLSSTKLILGSVQFWGKNDKACNPWTTRACECWCEPFTVATLRTILEIQL